MSRLALVLIFGVLAVEPAWAGGGKGKTDKKKNADAKVDYGAFGEFVARLFSGGVNDGTLAETLKKKIDELKKAAAGKPSQAELETLGHAVAGLLDRGLEGKELADAIRKEIARMKIGTAQEVIIVGPTPTKPSTNNSSNNFRYPGRRGSFSPYSGNFPWLSLLRQQMPRKRGK